MKNEEFIYVGVKRENLKEYYRKATKEEYEKCYKDMKDILDKKLDISKKYKSGEIEYEEFVLEYEKIIEELISKNPYEIIYKINKEQALKNKTLLDNLTMGLL